MFNRELWKRYLISSFLTFASGFSIVFIMELDHLSLNSFKDGSFVGAVFVGMRGGLKLLLEAFVNWHHVWRGKA